MKPETPRLPVAVIGAGPVGLAVAAHLISRGFTPLVFEAGAGVAANLESYRHVRLFSPWRYNVDREALRLLKATGWAEPPAEVLPTAGEIIDGYLAALARLPAIAAGLRFGARVVQVTRAGFDKVKTRGREAAPFVVRVETERGMEDHLAFAVIDAAGTWGSANPLGANGVPAIGEENLRHRIAYGMPDVLGRDRARYAGRRVLVVGAGHSAMGSLLALATLAEQDPRTEIAWAIRGDNLARIFGGGENDGLPARGELGLRLKALDEQGRLTVHTRFRIRELRDAGSTIDILAEGEAETIAPITGIHEIICATGARPDLSLARELRVKLDPWLESTEALAPLIDPNVHSCGTVRPHGFRELAHPERGFFMVGAKSYGRAPNFLMTTGYEQVRSVVAALAGDVKAAEEVQLELPETGVCSTQFGEAEGGAACCGTSERVPARTKASACCGGPAPADADACCVLDREAKVAGEAGCGCGSKPSPAKKSVEGTARCG
jgi:hypothetical protein